MSSSPGMTAFKDLGLTEQIHAIDELGFEEPTPVQEQAIPELLAGHDVIGQAQTGTGKTAAFGLPLLQYLDPGFGGDAGDRADADARALHPGHPGAPLVRRAHGHRGRRRVRRASRSAQQAPAARAGAQVVVATVGRMMDLISRHILVLTAARYVVLDEADEMLDLGFIEDVEKILRMCPIGSADTALLGDDAPADRDARRALHVPPGDDPGDPQAAHRGRDRAGVRGGRRPRQGGAAASRS